MTVSEQETRLTKRRSSLAALGPLLQDQKFVIERVRQDTRSIRESYSSQVGFTADEDRQDSSESHSNFNSSIGDETFSFDTEIVNSLAYRNAINRLASKSKTTQQSAKSDEHHILDQPLIDLEEPPQSQEGPGVKSKAISNHPCLTPISKFIHTDRLSDGIVEDLKSLLPISVGSPSQQTNARPADIEYRGSIGEKSVNASDNERENNGDVEKVTGQCVSDDLYQEPRNPHELPGTPLRGLDQPSPRSNPSLRMSADALDSFGKDRASPMTMLRQICSSDVTRRSILLKKPKTQSSPWVERLRGTNSVSQQAARGLPQVVSSSPDTPASVRGGLATTYSNVSCLNFEPLFDDVERDYVTSRLRRPVERDTCHKPEDEGHYDRIDRRNPFEGGGASDSSLSVEYSNRNSEINGEEKTSTDTITYNEKKAPRKKYREQHLRRVIAGGILTAAALKQHERRHSSSSHDTDLILPKQEHRRRQVKDHRQDSESDVALLSQSIPEGCDVVASNSIKGNPRLLDSVERAIRKLSVPDVETMKQEPTTKRNKLSHKSPIAPDGNAPRGEFSHKLSKHVSVLDPSGNPKAFTKRNEKNACVREEDDLAIDVSRRYVGRADRTSYSIPEDGSPVTIPFSQPLLIECFEGKKKPNIHSRPSGRVKVTPSSTRKIKDENKHGKLTTSQGSRKPLSSRLITLDPYSTKERQTTESTNNKSSASFSLPTEGSSLAYRSPSKEIEVMHRDQDSELSDPNPTREERYTHVNSSRTSSRRRSRSRYKEKESMARKVMEKYDKKFSRRQ